jgi:hypothetical protein
VRHLIYRAVDLHVKEANAEKSISIAAANRPYFGRLRDDRVSVQFAPTCLLSRSPVFCADRKRGFVQTPSPPTPQFLSSSEKPGYRHCFVPSYCVVLHSRRSFAESVGSRPSFDLVCFFFGAGSVLSLRPERCTSVRVCYGFNHHEA